MIFQFPASVWPLTSHIMLCAHSCQCYCNSKYNTKPPIIPTFLKKCTNSLSNSVGKIAMERSAKAGNLTFFGTALVQRPTFMTNVQWQVSTVGPKQKTKNVSTRTKPTATRFATTQARRNTRREEECAEAFPDNGMVVHHKGACQIIQFVPRPR